MPYQRVIHYGPDPGELTGSLSNRAVAGCWFELRRWGGCGDGELRLRNLFPERDQIVVGDWVSLEYQDGDRWYLGRVTERRADSAAGILLKLQGMSSQLDGVFPGGFGSEADGVAPHRYGCTELFPEDPDAPREQVDCVSRPEDLVRLLLEQYLALATDIISDEELIEDATTAAELVELKLHGTETATAILRDLALRARNASWGVDEQGRFYLLQQRTSVAAEWQEGRDLISLRETADEDLIFNRVLLTGGLVYAECDSPPCGSFRWQGNYLQPQSLAQFGERRIRVSIPWIRTSADSQAFVREFFRVYAQPTPHYRIEVAQQSLLIRPWLSSVQVLDRSGNVLVTGQPEVVRVQFDHTPKFQIDLGPVDPRRLWATSRDGEIWPIAGSEETGFGGGPVDVTSDAASSSSLEIISSDNEGESVSGYTDCQFCAKTAIRWKVTLAGIEPGLCADCDQMNGEWILERDFNYSYCLWKREHPACRVGTFINQFRLVMNSHGVFFYVMANSLYAAKYSPQAGVFHCLGANVFERFEATPLCESFPATITIEPA